MDMFSYTTKTQPDIEGELELMAAKLWVDTFQGRNAKHPESFTEDITEDACKCANVALWHFRNQFLNDNPETK